MWGFILFQLPLTPKTVKKNVKIGALRGVIW